ncbi:MAG TPA: metallopeptidase family protein [Solirubrobacteraceae bacterium]|jgi:predicted Zn-dependent protease with MMP-like domain|nr:metallopeptidase family protein [Solirubrobacteraceae bacterium]
MPAPSLRRIGLAAGIALCAGLATAGLLEGSSAGPLLRWAEWVALVVLAVAAIAGFGALLALRLAGWRNPESERDFEALVRRSEQLARDGLAVEPGESEFLELDPLDDDDFAELVREALDELPDLLRNALEHVAVVISDDGRRRGAYGLYHGDGAHRDNVPDRIVIYRDTLRRDFGHDPELLRDQVVRTVRHELAHHVGFDEMGVHDLGL